MQERKEETVVTLFRDIPHAIYSGIRPQPGIDIEFRLERFHHGTRLIRARLVKNGVDPKSFDFVTGGSFEMSSLGRDYERLESLGPEGQLGAELTSITRFVERVSIAVEPDGSALMRLVILSEEQLFKIYRQEPDRPAFECWDWFANPNQLSNFYPEPLHAARPIGEVAKVLAAA